MSPLSRREFVAAGVAAGAGLVMASTCLTGIHRGAHSRPMPT
jgi:hypothetical protein